MEEIVFFKQKTAYEMRISDWSSDVCSSDLNCPGARSWTGASTRADFSRSEQAEARTSVRRMATQRPWNTILPTINLLQQPAANACHCGPATPMPIARKARRAETHTGSASVQRPSCSQAERSEEQTSELQSLLRHS